MNEETALKMFKLLQEFRAENNSRLDELDEKIDAIYNILDQHPILK